MVRVGIPRALLYYQYYPMWRAFFEALGAEVVISPETTAESLAFGAARVVVETCLPVKVFIGHAIYLSDKCDCLFIPAIRSIQKKVFNCSEFLGLPDMTKAVVPEAPPILDTDIDVNRGKRRLYWNIYRLGSRFNQNPFKIRGAARFALKVLADYRSAMQEKRLTPPEALNGQPISRPDPESPGSVTLALVGHPYLLYDDYVNHWLIPRLRSFGCRVVSPEMLSPEKLRLGLSRISGGAYWTYETEVVGAGGYFLEAGVDGVIGVAAFGCGPDSLMMEIIRRRANTLETPFMILTFEEHTAETGVVTRLEAFLDMIKRRKDRVCV